MRNIILGALIATTAFPAIASAQGAEFRRDRHDSRQDWREYRNHNRDIFRAPAYVGPRGYRYRPLAPGHRLEPAYFGQRYVIADPYRYRLPRAAPAERWVRYGNDVVLVNIRTGRVVNVYSGFFF